MTGESPRAAESEVEVGELSRLFDEGELVALTGAGVSTDSGIPAYRDEEGQWKQSPPMQYRDFVNSARARQRYWARSALGWERMAQAAPNLAHVALASAEKRGALRLLVTQNVDGLHSLAGHENVVDLHGRLDRVICLGCGRLSPRAELQSRLFERNGRFAHVTPRVLADGDVDLPSELEAEFEVVACSACGGVLKPDVVFFGERVPADRPARVLGALEGAKALLVLGSSLMVFSGYRFARAAAKLGVPIVVVNRGRTRADELASLKVSANVGAVLERALASS